MIETCSHVRGYRRICQDVAGVFEMERGFVLVVADGAGGIEDGEIAARTVVEFIRQQSRGASSPINWELVLRQVDAIIPSGHSTACVVELTAGLIRGASVGDSQVGILGEDAFSFPSEGQFRKPLLGSREAVPRSFTSSWDGSLVLLGTDGFWNYVKAERIVKEVRHIDFPLLAHGLSEMVRLPSGGFPDDVALVCARTRQAYPAYERMDLLDDM